jgi:hypothetical protein
MARPTKAQQDARKAQERERREQATTKTARIAGPWDVHKARKEAKVRNRRKYLRRLELRRIDAERKAERESPEYREREAEQYRASTLEYEQRKQARLAELRAGAEATIDDTFIWDTERQMAKGTLAHELAVARDDERRQVEKLGPDDVDREAARAEMAQELGNREAERLWERQMRAQAEYRAQGGVLSSMSEDELRAEWKEQREQREQKERDAAWAARAREDRRTLRESRPKIGKQKGKRKR